MQVPRATARSGSSATWNWMFIFSDRRLSSPRRREPPPLREDLYRVAGHQVGTADQERFRFFVQLREDGAHGNLDFFRRGFTYFNHVLLTQVVLDIGRENVAGHTHGILHHNAAQGDDGDFRGTTSNVYHHIALRRLHIQADTQGCCHGLIDEVYVPAAGVLRGVADGTDFHLRGAGRNAHHQFEVGGEQAAVTS